MRNRIALTGKMRSGKDYVADILAKDYMFSRYAYGDELKRYARELFPEHFESGAKPRWLLQNFGQMMREIEADVWRKAMWRKIERQNPGRIVVSDLRQPNEFAELRERGFFIVKVVADDSVRLERMLANGDNVTAHDLQHDTESHVDGFDADYVLVNNGGDITKKIEQIVLGEY